MSAYRNLPALLACATLALALNTTGCKSALPPADDATLSTAVQNRLSADSALSSESVQSAVQGGIATLTGSVSSEAARSLAAADAAQVNGIRTVVNNLSVRQPAPAVAAVAPPAAPVAATPHQAPRPAIKPAPVVRESAPAENIAQAPPQLPPPSTPPAEPAPPPPPAAPPVPAFRTVTLLPKTVIPVRITQTLDSATTQQGDTFTGVIANDVLLDDQTILRQGTPVSGRVSAVQEAAHYKGNSLLTVELTSIDRRSGERLLVSTELYSVKGAGRGKNTAAKVGGGAAVGAVLGGIFGGGTGAAIGAATGGGVGAATNTVTRGQQVQIASETVVAFQLSSPLSVQVSTRNADGQNPNPELQPRPQSQQPQ
jgi:hypothetical protein